MRMIPDEIIPTVVREKIIVTPVSEKGPKLKKRKRVVVSDDEDSDVDVLSDNEERGIDIEAPFNNNEMVDDGFIELGGEEIHEPLVDYNFVDNQNNASSSTSVGVSKTTRSIEEQDSFDIGKYKVELKEKSKELYKTNGHMDLDKVLKLSQKNLAYDNESITIQSLPSLSFIHIDPPQLTTSSLADSDDILIDIISFDDIESSATPPQNKPTTSIPSTHGNKKVKIDFYD